MNNNIEIKKTLITYEKYLDFPIIINPKFKGFLMHKKEYNIKSNDKHNDYSLTIKIFPDHFYFMLKQINKKEKDNSDNNNHNNISFFENKYEIKAIKKYFYKNKEINNLEEINQRIHKEIINNNIQVINDIENKIKLLFNNYNNISIELNKIDLYQRIKNHSKLINDDYICHSDINPNLFYKNTIIENSLKIFEVYYPFDNPYEIFLIYQNNKNLNLEIFNITKMKNISCLKNISGKVTLIKHFFNQKNSYDYLCTSDTKKIIYVYNLSLNYNLLYQIKTYYTFNIFICLLFFDNKNNNNYLITSTYAINGDNYSKAYTLEDGSFIKNYPGTDENSTSFLIYWYHKILKRNYIIELCSEKIFIYEITTNGLYVSFDIKNVDFLHGCIIKKSDKEEFLYCSTYNNNIYIFDLYKKKLKYIINLLNKVEKSNKIYDIIKWSDKYILICNYNRKSLDIFDTIQNKIISCIKDIDNSNFLFFKKIIHPNYGESLLASSENNTIKIFI